MHAAWQSPEDGGARGPRNARRACAMRLRYLLGKQRYQAQPRGGCCRGCDGARRSKRVGGHAACAAAAHGERAGGSGRCDGESSRGRVAHLHETQACKSELQRDREISSGARSGRAGSLKDEGNRTRRPLRGADVVRLRAHQPMSGLKRTTEVVEHREGGDPSTAHKSPGRTTFSNSSWPSRCSAVGRPSTWRYPT